MNQYRMKELGLTKEEYEIYKYLYNNVSVSHDEIKHNFGEKMYIKFAKAFKAIQAKEPEVVSVDELYNKMAWHSPDKYNPTAFDVIAFIVQTYPNGIIIKGDE